MTAAELVHLIYGLHHPDRAEEYHALYAALDAYLIDTEFDWQSAMNEPAEEGLIRSGVYFVWAQDAGEVVNFWDTTGRRYLIPHTFQWPPVEQT